MQKGTREGTARRSLRSAGSPPEVSQVLRLRELKPLMLVTVLCVCAMDRPAQGAPAEIPESWGNLEGPWLLQTDPADVGEKDAGARPSSSRPAGAR